MADVLLRCWKGVGGFSKVLQHHEPVPGISCGCAFAGELLERSTFQDYLVPYMHVAVFSVLTSPRLSPPPHTSGMHGKVQGQELYLRLRCPNAPWSSHRPKLRHGGQPVQWGHQERG